VNDTDQILQRSKAMGFAKKNKMRFHGIRMIASFHLAHLFSSVSDFFTEQYHEVAPTLKQLNGKSDVKEINLQKENERIMDHIRNSKDTFELAQVEYHLDTDEQKEAFAQRLKEIEQHLDFVPVKEMEQ
jgi:flagellar motility protein MotE (MotC chaperone)